MERQRESETKRYGKMIDKKERNKQGDSEAETQWDRDVER